MGDRDRRRVSDCRCRGFLRGRGYLGPDGKRLCQRERDRNGLLEGRHRPAQDGGLGRDRQGRGNPRDGRRRHRSRDRKLCRHGLRGHCRLRGFRNRRYCDCRGLRWRLSSGWRCWRDWRDGHRHHRLRERRRCARIQHRRQRKRGERPPGDERQHLRQLEHGERR